MHNYHVLRRSNLMIRQPADKYMELFAEKIFHHIMSRKRTITSFKQSRWFHFKGFIKVSFFESVVLSAPFKHILFCDSGHTISKVFVDLVVSGGNRSCNYVLRLVVNFFQTVVWLLLQLTWSTKDLHCARTEIYYE